MKMVVLILLFVMTTLSGQALSCGLNITGSGNISTPDFPENYPENSFCVWYLRAERGGRLRLEFLSLSLEAGVDFLIVYRGDPSNESLDSVFFSYTGYTIPSPVVLDERAKLVFTSDDSVAYSGFFISVTTLAVDAVNGSPVLGASEQCTAQGRYFCSRSQQCVTALSLCNGWLDCVLGEDEANCTINSETTAVAIVANRTDVGCGGNLSGSGNVSSPNYPLRYPNSANCTWKLLADVGHVLELSIRDFALESDYDILSVYQVSQNLSNVLLRRYTGVVTPVKLIAGNEAVLVFTSDYSTSFRGFLLSFSSVYPPGTTVFPSTDSTLKVVCMDQNAYLCRKSSECLNESARCDGRFDCVYGDDEEACSMTASSAQGVGPSLGISHSTTDYSIIVMSKPVSTGGAVVSETLTISDKSSGTTANASLEYSKPSSAIPPEQSSTMRTSVSTDSQTYTHIDSNLTVESQIIYPSSLLSPSTTATVVKETTEKTLTVAMTTAGEALQATTSSTQPGSTSGAEQAKCASSLDYWCNNSRKCVPVKARCNGTLECALGDDEAGCPTLQPTVSQSKTTHGLYSDAPRLLELDISVLGSAAVCLRSPTYFVTKLISLWFLVASLR